MVSFLYLHTQKNETMKNIFFTLIIALSAMVISCGPNKEEGNKKSAEDSIKKSDSIINLLVGSWKEEGKSTHLTIAKAGNLFTITSDAGVTYAYKLNGQLLNSVDGTGPTYSIIGNNELLKGSTKYFKASKDDNENNSTTSSGSGTKSTKHTKTKSSSANGSAGAVSSGSNASSSSSGSGSSSNSGSGAKELKIYTETSINLFQSPSTSAAIIKSLLNDQVCKVIGKTHKQYTLNGKTDYWYNVSVEGDEGWVFGALTSLRQH